MENIELFRNLLSAVLSETNEEVHLKCDITINTNEDVALSDLEKIHISEIWQHPSEGIITILIDGFGECDLDDYEEFIPQIYQKLT